MRKSTTPNIVLAKAGGQLHVEQNTKLCPPSPILFRCAQYKPSVMLGHENTFFTKEIYDSEIALGVNQEVLERIYGDGITTDTSLPIEFVFVSDHEQKLKNLGLALLSECPEYTGIRVQPYYANFELQGITQPVRMELQTINKWNQEMWDLGYQFDCKLDGWQVGT
jgi:hypothetical protein